MITPKQAEKLTDKEVENINFIETVIDEQLIRNWTGKDSLYIDLDVYYTGKPKPTKREVVAICNKYSEGGWNIKYSEESNRFNLASGE